MYLYIMNETICFLNRSSTLPDQITYGNWLHICIHWSNKEGNVEFYFNGEKKWSNTNVMKGKEILGGKFLLGHALDTSGNILEQEGFIGMLTQFYVWNGADDLIHKMALGCSDSKLSRVASLAWPEMQQWINGDIEIISSTPCTLPGKRHT